MLTCPYTDEANTFAFLALRRLGYDVLTGKELKRSTEYEGSDDLLLLSLADELDPKVFKGLAWAVNNLSTNWPLHFAEGRESPAYGANLRKLLLEAGLTQTIQEQDYPLVPNDEVDRWGAGYDDEVSLIFNDDNEFASFELRRLGYDVSTGTEVKVSTEDANDLLLMSLGDDLTPEVYAGMVWAIKSRPVDWALQFCHARLYPGKLEALNVLISDVGWSDVIRAENYNPGQC